MAIIFFNYYQKLRKALVALGLFYSVLKWSLVWPVMLLAYGDSYSDELTALKTTQSKFKEIGGHDINHLKLKYFAKTATLYFNGYVTQGSYSRVKKVLRKNKVENLLLDSNGGLIDPALKIAKLISKSEINTFVLRDCHSACILIFTASENRTIAPGSSIGCHQSGYNIPGGFHEIGSPYYYKLRSHEHHVIKWYQDAGIDLAFIERCFSTKYEDMWYARMHELREANVATDAMNISKIEKLKKYPAVNY